MICQNCGAANSEKSTVCSNCGTRLCQESTSRHKSGPKDIYWHTKGAKHRRTLVARKAWFDSPVKLAMVFLAVVMVAVLYGTRREQKSVTPVTVAVSLNIDPALQPGYDDVVSRFICSCGRCTEPLYQCTCSVAQEEKSTIAEDLENGERPPEIFDAIYKAYGHLAYQSSGAGGSDVGTGFDPQSLAFPK